MELVVRKDNTMKLFGKKAQPKKEEPKMQEAVLTLYACRKDVKTVPDLACRLFSEVMDKILYTDEDEFHIQFKDGTGVQFHLVTDAEETEVQSKGMASFFSRAPLENEAVKDAALCQIRLFNCIIGIRFEIDGDSNRTNYIVNTIYGMAGELSAFGCIPICTCITGMAVCCCRLTERVILRSFIPRQAPRFWIGRRKKRRPTENGKCVPLPF